MKSFKMYILNLFFTFVYYFLFSSIIENNFSLFAITFLANLVIYWKKHFEEERSSSFLFVQLLAERGNEENSIGKPRVREQMND